MTIRRKFIRDCVLDNQKAFLLILFGFVVMFKKARERETIFRDAPSRTGPEMSWLLAFP